MPPSCGYAQILTKGKITQCNKHKLCIETSVRRMEIQPIDLLLFPRKQAPIQRGNPS